MPFWTCYLFGYSKICLGRRRPSARVHLQDSHCNQPFAYKTDPQPDKNVDDQASHPYQSLNFRAYDAIDIVVCCADLGKSADFPYSTNCQTPAGRARGYWGRLCRPANTASACGSGHHRLLSRRHTFPPRLARGRSCGTPLFDPRTQRHCCHGRRASSRIPLVGLTSKIATGLGTALHEGRSCTG